MLDISGKTFYTLLMNMLNRVSESVNKREGSLIRTSLAAAAWAIEGIYIELAYIQKQAFALFASGDYLDYKVAERGLTRKPATASVRKGVFNIAPPVGSEFAAKNVSPLLVYRVTSKPTQETIKDDKGAPVTQYVADLTCAELGTIGDSYSGDLLSLDFIAGLTSAKVTDIKYSGTDIETDESLRARYVDSMQGTPFGGNVDSYRQFILAIEGVGGVQVYPHPDGAGTVTCSIINDNYQSPTDELVSKVQLLVNPPSTYQNTSPSTNSYGYGVAPIGALVTISSATSYNVEIEATLVFNDTTLEIVKDEAIARIKEYILSVCKTWGTPVSRYDSKYEQALYTSRVIYTLLEINGVKNVTGVKINGQTEVLELEESSTIQYLPVLYRVTINGTVIFQAE